MALFDRDKALSLLSCAKTGELDAREGLIEVAKPFVVGVVSRHTGRRIDWHDDELSVGLMAFNESIDAYKGAGPGFFSFSREVIRKRLIDYYRTQAKYSQESTSLDENGEGDIEASPPEVREAWVRYQLQEEALEWAEEIEVFKDRLKNYGISIGDLVRESPSHRDTRNRLLKAASFMAQNGVLMRSLEITGKLPKKDLCQVPGVTSRVLDRGRKYVIAMSVILSSEDLVLMKEYLEVKGVLTVVRQGSSD